MIRWQCDCGHRLAAKPENVGRRVRCPKCEALQIVPQAPSTDASNQGVTEQPRPSVGPPAYQERRHSRQPAKKSSAGPWIWLSLAAVLLLAIGGVALWFFVPRDDATDQNGDIQLTVTEGMRAAAQRSKTINNFKQLGISFHNYADTRRGELPLHAIYSQDGKPLLSWRVTLLPFIEEDVLYRQFRLDEPWDSPHNLQLLPKMPKIYELSGHPAPKPSHTFIQVFTGPQTLFDGRKTWNIGGIRDGTSNTIFTVEAAKAVPWTKPADIPYSPKIDPRTQLGKHYGPFTLICLCDGSFRQISQNITEQTVRNAIMPADGNALGPDW